MNRSLEDAYNILLSRFENQTEVSYYSELSILLTNSDGEVYEMPDYTHIHSVKDSGSIEAYNFNDGLDCMRKVSIVNDDVVLERYNFRENKVRATLYKLTPATMKLAREYSHKDRDLASYAAKEIVGGYFPFICTLQKQSDVEITADNSDPFVYYLLCDGERVAEFAPGRSFYRDKGGKYTTTSKEVSTNKKQINTPTEDEVRSNIFKINIQHYQRIISLL